MGIDSSDAAGTLSESSRRCSTGWPVPIALCILGLIGLACHDEQADKAPQAVVDEVEVPTHLRIRQLTLENTSFDGQRGAGYADMYEPESFGGPAASDHADRIDFRYQYRGRDIGNQRSFENMTTKQRWDRLGLFTDITPTESLIAITSIDEATFDGIEDDVGLIDSFDFGAMKANPVERFRRVYLSNAEGEPLATVFAFIDKRGRPGLFKVVAAETAPPDTVAQGTLTIEIKIEDRDLESQTNS